MAAPTVVAASTVQAVTTAPTVTLPTGWQENDILVAIALSNNQAYSPNPPTGWTLAPNQPTGFGTAATAGAVRGFVWWKRAAAGEGSLVCSDSGNLNVVGMIAVRGCPTTGDPWDVSATANQTTANTSISWPDITTTGPDRLIVGCTFLDRDIASTADVGTVTNANLSGITEWYDNLTTAGVGGGIHMFTGTKASAGAIGTSTATVVSQVYSKWIGALKPESGQTLTQSSTFTNSPTFHAPTVTRGPVTLTPSLFQDTSSYYTHQITAVGGGQTLTQSSRYDGTPSFYAPTVTRGTVTLTATRYDNTGQFFGPTVTRGTVTLSASLYSDSDTFHSPTLTRGPVTLSPSLYNDTDNFYGPTVTRGTVTLTPNLYTNTATFYAATVTRGPVSLLPSLYSITNAFYAPTVARGTVTLTPALYSDSDTLHAPTVTQGPVVLSPARLDSSPSFFAPTVSRGSVTVTQASRFDDTDTFFGHVVSSGSSVLAPSLYTNANSFYVHTVTGSDITLLVPVLVNANGFYTHSVSTVQNITPPFFSNMGNQGGFDGSIKYDLSTGRLTKVINNKVVLTF